MVDVANPPHGCVAGRPSWYATARSVLDLRDRCVRDLELILPGMCRRDAHRPSKCCLYRPGVRHDDDALPGVPFEDLVAESGDPDRKLLERLPGLGHLLLAAPDDQVRPLPSGLEREGTEVKLGQARIDGSLQSKRLADRLRGLRRPWGRGSCRPPLEFYPRLMRWRPLQPVAAPARSGASRGHMSRRPHAPGRVGPGPRWLPSTPQT